MPGRNVSRRLFVGVMGGGVLAAPVVASARPETTSAAKIAAPSEKPLDAPTRENVAKLLHPLAAGSRLARWTIVQIDPVVNGCVSIKVRTDDGHTFDLELLARDRTALAQRPPAETERHAIFVVNGGNGWATTQEELGLAAMTLAQIVAKNEREVRLSGLLTHAERIENHGDALLVPAEGPG
ncbi:hypothetical protein [Polyangium fumosum]|uniref:Uncharacterized protein n=1 Tax=Polyangium fumosum TaxID=889272 RepID=A0A4U1J1F6_9BACT|nr:hypothetical protein [Polyangium fumosum]TKD00207.1 hypothetical protein E8A74_35370 [Polyangium fumosum]